MKFKFTIYILLVVLLFTASVFGINYFFSDRWQLSRAIKQSDYKRVELLLSSNDGLSREKIDTLTPLQIAAFTRNSEMIKLLIKKGAIVNEKGGRHSSTPLFTSSYLGDVQSMNVLLKNGANVNSKDIFNKTPLVFAVEGNSLKAVKVLIENNANVNIRSDSVSGNQSILYYAVENGNPKIVSILIDNGAKEDKERLFTLIEKQMRKLQDKNKINDYKKIYSIIKGQTW